MPYVPTVDGGLPAKVTMVDSGGLSVTPSTVTKEHTLVGNNTAGIQVPLFSVTGAVEVFRLYYIVTTAFGSNHTAAYFQINDQAATPDITLSTGVAVSNAAVGSLVSRHSLVSVAAILNNASAGVVKDPVAATAPGMFMPFIVVQKTGGVTTNIEYVYSTTNTPTTGAFKAYIQYRPLSDNGAITAV